MSYSHFARLRKALTAHTVWLDEKIQCKINGIKVGERKVTSTPAVYPPNHPPDCFLLFTLQSNNERKDMLNLEETGRQCLPGGPS